MFQFTALQHANLEVILTMIVLATLPVFLLLYYFWKRDQGEKEPMRLMRKAFLWGLAVTPLGGLASAGLFTLAAPLLDFPILAAFLTPFVLIALPEEYVKYWVVKRKIFLHHKFNEVMDGITYTILASMGFAILENILYIFEYGISVGYLRAFTAVPAHAMFSGIMGFYLGQAKFAKPAQRQKLFRRGLLAGVFFHGLYDFLLMSGVPILILLAFPLLAYMWFILHRAIKKAHNGKRLEPLRYF